MTRDPKVNPIFGDIFRYTIPKGTIEAMFVAGDETDWVACDVALGGGLTDGYIGVHDPSWVFIESIGDSGSLTIVWDAKGIAVIS